MHYEQFVLFSQCFHESLWFKLCIISTKNPSPLSCELTMFHCKYCSKNPVFISLCPLIFFPPFFKAVPGLAVYTGTKFYVEGLSQTMRLELKGTGVKVTCIQPGDVELDDSPFDHSSDKEASVTILYLTTKCFSNSEKAACNFGQNWSSKRRGYSS